MIRQGQAPGKDQITEIQQSQKTDKVHYGRIREKKIKVDQGFKEDPVPPDEIIDGKGRALLRLEGPCYQETLPEGKQ